MDALLSETSLLPDETAALEEIVLKLTDLLLHLPDAEVSTSMKAIRSATSACLLKHDILMSLARPQADPVQAAAYFSALGIANMVGFISVASH